MVMTREVRKTLMTYAPCSETSFISCSSIAFVGCCIFTYENENSAQNPEFIFAGKLLFVNVSLPLQNFTSFQ